MKNKKVKKNIQFLILVLTILGLAFSVFAYTKNELRFKYFNRLGISETNHVEKERYFNLAWNQKPEWALIVKSNKLDILYQEKKYEELKKKIGEIEKNECSLEKKEISEFCENIFYLKGLVDYQLGQKDKEKEEEFNKKAILEFKKTLAVNPKNIWAKENIEFLLKRQKELEKKKKKQNKKQEKGQQDKKDNKNQKDKKGSKNQEDQNGKEKKEDEKNSQKENKQGNKKDGKKSGENKKGNNGEKSRLPSQIQRALEQEQKKLEQQQKNQKGFARTKSKAEQNREQRGNPFTTFQNDPFFKDFFGNDSFFNQVFGNPKKNLRKDLSGGEDEKDW